MDFIDSKNYYLQELNTGEPYLPVVGKEEGCYFDLLPSDFEQTPCFELVVNLNSPTETDIEQCTEATFEIRATELNDAIFFTYKFGTMSWMDAPFDPVRCKNSLPCIPREGEGYTLLIITTDTRGGIIKQMRLIGLGHKFSVDLKKLLEKNADKNISHDDHLKKVDEVFGRYKTSQIVSYSSLRYKLHVD